MGFVLYIIHKLEDDKIVSYLMISSVNKMMQFFAKDIVEVNI